MTNKIGCVQHDCDECKALRANLADAEAKPASAEPVRFVPSITLTGKDIKDVAEFAGLSITPHDYADEYETEITIQRCPKSGIKNDDDGGVEFFEYVAYLSEYPEEGCVPLGDPVEPTGHSPQPAPDVQAAVECGQMMQDMVDRFLSWKLPKDFNPDAGITFTPTDLQKSGVHGWPTGTNLFTADQADKMIGYVAAPLLAKLLMYIHEERFNTTPQPAPDVQAAVAAALDGYKADRKDAERFRWLCEDHAGDEKKRRNILLDRMAVMTYSAICTDIDAELTGTPARTLTRAAPDLITAAADALATR